ncbi:hypothetical protein X975_12725, partial [Stegodyphus mimosarum]
MAWLLEQGTAPGVIPNGSMIMSVRHPSLNIRVIDSLNFLPMALPKLPGCFGLTKLKKGYFPHLFNSRENQSYVGPLPETQYYSPDSMSTSARQTFLAWHEAHKGDVFNFQAEMLAYCRYIFLSFILIYLIFCFIPIFYMYFVFLTFFLLIDRTWTFFVAAVWNFERSFWMWRVWIHSSKSLNRSYFCLFRYVTIASACMATYQSGHIQPDTIAMVPTHGYVNSTNYSPDSIRWL